MIELPLLIPILFITFISIGLAAPKTLAVGTAFSFAIVLGFWWGRKIDWKDEGLRINEKYLKLAFWIALAIIPVQILLLGKVPLLDPAVRTSLNPRLTALTYFLGVPSSVYLFLRGKRYSLLYPILVSLYAYRTPVLVGLFALGAAHYEKMKDEGRIQKSHMVAIIVAITVLGIGMALLRGETIGSSWFRIQGTTSVLDVIVERTPWHGFYHGYLQFSGITSYFKGGYSPRGLVAKFLYIRGVTITPTLLGGIYLDFGLFSLIFGFLLGLHYGLLKRATHPTTKALYYSTLAYGLFGVETGILDLPVYVLFVLSWYVVAKGLKGSPKGREP